MCSTDTSSSHTDLGLTDKNGACACSTDSHSSAESHNHGAVVGEDSDGSHADGVIREHYLVSGMTCNHCVSTVTEELSELDGVTDVSFTLNAGGVSQVMVVSSIPVPVDQVRSSLSEAGYGLVPA